MCKILIQKKRCKFFIMFISVHGQWPCTPYCNIPKIIALLSEIALRTHTGILHNCKRLRRMPACFPTEDTRRSKQYVSCFSCCQGSRGEGLESEPTILCALLKRGFVLNVFRRQKTHLNDHCASPLSCVLKERKETEISSHLPEA